MLAPINKLTLAFSTTYGRFTIRPDERQLNLFTLEIQQHETEPVLLAHYCSLNDAIFAVANQETGFLKWDGLRLEHVPYKVHDITCWEFGEFSGTNAQELCS